MPLSAEAMRTILLLCLLGMSVLAVLFLRGRRMSWEAYMGWGILAILFPILGPFIVIASRPGKTRSQ